MASERLEVYSYWGIDISKGNSEEVITTCPFCLHNDKRTNAGHFYISRATAAFSCKSGSCGREGSWREFLKEIYKKKLKQTTDEQLLALTKLQGLPLPILKERKVAYDPSYKKYFLPAYNGTEITDLRCYRKNKKEHSTKGAIIGLTNLLELIEDNSDCPIYICEGFRDQLALQWLLWRTGEKGIVIGAPGSNTFKEDWAKAFLDRNVFIVYDNDEAGYGHIEGNKISGSLKVAARLKPHTKSVSFITWPDTYAQSYDIRDLINNNKKEPGKCLNLFTSFLSPRHKVEKLELINDPEKRNIRLCEVIEAAGKIYELNPNFVNAIKVALATAFSVKLQGNDNVWTMLVGSPGEGKSIVCEMFENSRHVIWESTLTQKGLVSGWGLGQSTLDTSILNRVHNRCLVVKDLSQLLKANQTERDAVFGILINAFDGRHKQPYGTGERVYICSFSMLVGITYSIYTYDTAAFGERFLKYIIKGGDAEKIQEKALESQIFGSECREELKTLVARFLDNEYDLSAFALRSRVPEWFRQSIKPLGRLIAHLRTPVARYEGGMRMGEMRLTPTPETGNRPTIQLEKLAIMLSIIEEKDQIDEEIYLIIKKMALDTIFSFSTLIVKTLIHSPDYVEVKHLKERTGIRRLDYYLEDLEALKVIERNCSKPARYTCSENIRELWKRARL